MIAPMFRFSALLIAAVALAGAVRTLPAATCNPVSATLCVAVDDFADVWINGTCVLLCADNDFAYIDSTSGTPVSCLSIPPSMLSATGTNYIAVMVRNTNPTEMWGTWALDILCAGGAHSYATSSDSFDFFHDASGTTPPPLDINSLPWYDPAYQPVSPWGSPVTVGSSVYGKRALDPQTGTPLPPKSWNSSGSGSGQDRMYFRQGFGLTPQPTPVPPNMTVQLFSSVCAMQNGANFDVTVRLCNSGGNVTNTVQVTVHRDPEVAFCGPYSPVGYTITQSGNDSIYSFPGFAGSSCMDYVMCGVDYYIGPSEVGTIRRITADLVYPGGTDVAGLDIPAVNCIVFTPTPTRSYSATPTQLPTDTVSPTPAAPTATSTATPTRTATPTVTTTLSPPPTATVTVTPTITETFTPAPTPPPATATPEPLLLTPKHPNPSPAKDAVWIPYVLNTAAEVDIRIYDVSGELLLALGPIFQSAGAQERRWDLMNKAGTKVASGVYICRIVATSPAGETDDAWVKAAVAR